MKTNRVTFNDLSVPLKIAIVFSYFVLGVYIGFFLVGFMYGMVVM